MPNWTTNVLKINGDQKDILAFLNTHIIDNDLDFNTILPEPKTKEECPEEYFVNEDSHIMLDEERPWFDWYHFHWNVWGVKWNACDTYIAFPDEDNSSNMDCDLYIEFNTPWNPPIPVIDKLASMHPKLDITLKYVEEQGPLYTGIFEYNDGALRYSYEPKEYSKDAYEIMFDIWNNKDDYEWDEKNHTYKLKPEFNPDYVFDEYEQRYIELDNATQNKYYDYINNHKDEYITMETWYNKYMISDKKA